MKKIFLVLSLFLLASSLQAQYVLQSFESAANDNYYKVPPSEAGNGTGRGWVKLSDTTDAKFGTKAMKIDWLLHSNQSYGGYLAISHQMDVTADSGKYFDFSPAKYVSIWFRTLKPSTVPTAVEFRFKIHEASGSSKYYSSKDNKDAEDWYFQSKAIFDDASNSWKQLLIPLVNNDPNGGTSPDDKGFTLPGWSGVKNDGKLLLNKIIGYRFEATAGVITIGDSTAKGTIELDNMQLLDAAYKPIEDFNNKAGITGYYTFGGNDNGAVTISDDKTAPFEGASALKLDYKINAYQTWGGFCNVSHEFPKDSALDLSSKDAVYIYWKINKAANYNTMAGKGMKVNCRFILFDDDGTREEWMSHLTVNLDNAPTGEWVMDRIPLEQLGLDWDIQTTGFKLPQGQSDKNFHLNKIGGYKLEFSTSAQAPFTTGYVCDGSISVDLLVPAGFRDNDKTPPAAVTGVSAVAGKYSNLISWNDVAGETGEVYNVYYSTKPITDLTAKDVELLKIAVPENTGVATHLLRTPLTDADVSYYYAVTCTDKAGNVGKPGGGATLLKNKAQGVPTIANVVPTNFVANGNIKEFTDLFTANGFKPFTMKSADGTASVAPNTKVDGDADCSALVYLAIDKTNLYIAWDVTDDVVAGKTATNTWERDAPDLFIGFYDFHGIANTHNSLLRGSAPDYHLRFNENKVIIDGANTDSLLLPGANYYWGEKLSGGYVVEAKIPLNDFAKKRNSGQTNFDDLFVPQEGMRIPFDLEINDADLTGIREGIICYSPNNEDKSYTTPTRWLDTWIGKKATVGVEKTDSKEMTYQLAQNYPNPFNPSTVIKYSIANPGKVTLKVYDIIGKEIATLVNQDQDAGSYQVKFDASRLSSGIYFYRIESGSFSQVNKMMLVK